MRIAVCLQLVWLLLFSYTGSGQPHSTLLSLRKAEVGKYIDSQLPVYRGLALQIWSYAELSFNEKQSAEALKDCLQQAGFTVQSRVAGMPTAFVASFGSGKPIIGILAEFDALPGVSQDTTATRQSHPGVANGHACGHHLLGVGSVLAAIAVKQEMQKAKFPGTIRVYGCPAEEGGGGKVYMVREGLFADADAVLHWHPWDQNRVVNGSTLAIQSAKFRFYGTSSHAAAAPEKGRSALDGVEAMNYMANLLREHVPAEARIHYVITDGGKAPNVVPDFAEVFYYVRHTSRTVVGEVFNRLVSAAEGAAQGTGTRMEYEILDGAHNILLNRTLAEVLYTNLKTVGGIKLNEREKSYAIAIQKTFLQPPPSLSDAEQVKQLEGDTKPRGSSDVGDVSHVVPTAGIFAATWVPGTSSHTWQATSAGGTSIGIKGMAVAAKTLAYTCIDLFSSPGLLRRARTEMTQLTGGYLYSPMIGDRKPPINYRD